MLTKAINIKEGDMFRRKSDHTFKLASVVFTIQGKKQIVIIDWHCYTHTIDCNEEVLTIAAERILDEDDLPF